MLNNKIKKKIIDKKKKSIVLPLLIFCSIKLNLVLVILGDDTKKHTSGCFTCHFVPSRHDHIPNSKRNLNLLNSINGLQMENQHWWASFPHPRSVDLTQGDTFGWVFNCLFASCDAGLGTRYFKFKLFFIY
jgi:hypothetical protein